MSNITTMTFVLPWIAFSSTDSNFHPKQRDPRFSGFHAQSGTITQKCPNCSLAVGTSKKQVLKRGSARKQGGPRECSDVAKLCTYSNVMFQELLRLHKNKNLKFGPTESPAWDRAEASTFIVSVIRNMPTTPLIIRELEVGSPRNIYSNVIDGRQRLETLLHFVCAHELGERTSSSRIHKLQGLTGKNDSWNGVTFRTLDPLYQDRIKSFKFNVLSIPSSIDNSLMNEILENMFQKARQPLDAVPSQPKKATSRTRNPPGNRITTEYEAFVQRLVKEHSLLWPDVADSRLPGYIFAAFAFPHAEESLNQKIPFIRKTEIRRISLQSAEQRNHEYEHLRSSFRKAQNLARKIFGEDGAFHVWKRTTKKSRKYHWSEQITVPYWIAMLRLLEDHSEDFKEMPSEDICKAVKEWSEGFEPQNRENLLISKKLEDTKRIYETLKSAISIRMN